MTEDLTNKAGTWIIELKDLREKILFYEAASRKARAEFLSKLYNFNQIVRDINE